MTLQDAREEVIKRGIELLEKDESGNRLICPICRCGSDEDEKGLSSQDKVHFTCPLGCFSNADFIVNILYLASYFLKFGRSSTLFISLIKVPLAI